MTITYVIPIVHGEIILDVKRNARFYNTTDNIWFSWNGSEGVNSWVFGYSSDGVYIGPYGRWYCFARKA